MPEATAATAERVRAATLALLGILASLAAFSIASEPAGPVLRGLLALTLLGPLLAAVPGLWRRERRTYAWATLCLTPHFVYALTEIVANPAVRALAAAMLASSLAVMVALVAYLRLTRPTAARAARAGTES